MGEKTYNLDRTPPMPSCSAAMLQHQGEQAEREAEEDAADRRPQPGREP